VYIAVASCAHISPYIVSVVAMAGVFCPKMLVATNDVNTARFSVTSAGGTVAPNAAS